MELEYKGERGEKSFVKVPVVKASTKEEPSWVEVCVEDIPQDVFNAVVMLGLKHFVNGGMTKITGTKDGASMKAAFEIATKNVDNIYTGKVRMPSGVSRSKVSGAVKTEAMRLARLLIKDALKASGKKVSHIPAKEITAAAKLYLEGEAGAEIITVAENNIKEREEKEQSQKGALAGILSTINIDPKLVAAAEAKAKKGRKTTEDKKASAGVLQRSKPGTEARTQH